MNEDAFSLFGGHFDKVKDIFGRFVVLVEKDLALNILPKEGQVDDSKALPLILYLLARAIDHSGHLVHLNEIQVLPQ